jgi:hypothetical protein
MMHQMIAKLVANGRPELCFMLGLCGIGGAIKGLRFFMQAAAPGGESMDVKVIDKMIMTALEGLFGERESSTEVVAKMNAVAAGSTIAFVDTDKTKVN